MEKNDIYFSVSSVLTRASGRNKTYLAWIIGPMKDLLTSSEGHTTFKGHKARAMALKSKGQHSTLELSWFTAYCYVCLFLLCSNNT